MEALTKEWRPEGFCETRSGIHRETVHPGPDVAQRHVGHPLNPLSREPLQILDVGDAA